jgi:hypothetical protein
VAGTIGASKVRRGVRSARNHAVDEVAVDADVRPDEGLAAHLMGLKLWHLRHHRGDRGQHVVGEQLIAGPGGRGNVLGSQCIAVSWI